MRRLLLIVPLLLSLAAASTGAQEARWKELQSQASAFFGSRKCEERLPVVERTLAMLSACWDRNYLR